MNYFKIVLAALLLLCLLDMPYGFYILIRYVATVVFGYMAYSYYQENKKELAIAAGALAVLFQPFIKFALLCSPASVAVHDDGDVLGYVGCIELCHILFF